MKLIKLFSILLILTACTSVRYGHLTVRSHGHNELYEEVDRPTKSERSKLSDVSPMTLRHSAELESQWNEPVAAKTLEALKNTKIDQKPLPLPGMDSINIHTIKDYKAAIDAVVPNDGDGPSIGMIILIVILSIVAIIALIYLIMYLIILSIADSIAQNGCMVTLIAGGSFITYLFLN